MFNRTIQLDVVKKDKKSPTEEVVSVDDAVSYAAIADVAVRNIAEHAITVIGTYMLFDTIRKIAVNRLSK
jgi:hypothetical protein